MTLYADAAQQRHDNEAEKWWKNNKTAYYDGLMIRIYDIKKINSR